MRKHEDDALLFIERLRQVYQDKGYAFFDKGDYNLNIGLMTGFVWYIRLMANGLLTHTQPQQNPEPAY